MGAFINFNRYPQLQISFGSLNFLINLIIDKTFFMKKMLAAIGITSFVFAFTVLIVSFGNKDSTKGELVNMRLIREVEKLPNSIVYLGVDRLNSREKVVFWNRHLDEYVSTHVVSKELSQHIQKLRDFIKVETFDAISKNNDSKLINDFTHDWLVTPIKKGIFTNKTLSDIATLSGVGTKEQTLYYLNKKAYMDNIECNCTMSYQCYSSVYPAATCVTTPGSCLIRVCGIVGTLYCNGQCNFGGTIDDRESL